MRLGFTYREGLVLHEVGWDDGVRASARSRTGSRSPRWWCPTATRRRSTSNRTAFDVGEWGLGFMTTSLELGCDCLGEITYVDAVLHDSAGEPTVIRNAICLHEEDDGVAWKHVDGLVGARGAPPPPDGRVDPRHRRELRVPRVLAVLRRRHDRVRGAGHRDHGHHPVPEGEAPPYGTVVDARTYAPIHQHFIVARLDLDVDGEAEHGGDDRDGAAADRPGQPVRSRARPGSEPLTTEGGFDPNWATQRAWKVTSSTRRNAHGAPTAYKLAPSGAFPAMLDPIVAGVRARPGDRPHAVGHAVPRRGAVAVRGVRQPVRVRRGPRGVDAGAAADRGHRRRALVRLRHPPRAAGGGLAGDAGRRRVVPARPGRVLRPQPRAGRRAAAGARRGARHGAGRHGS